MFVALPEVMSRRGHRRGFRLVRWSRGQGVARCHHDGISRCRGRVSAAIAAVSAMVRTIKLLALAAVFS